MRSSRRSCQKCRNRRWKDDKEQDPVAFVAGLHGRSSSNYRHMAFCSGSFAHRSYFDLFCRECGFVRKKSRYQTASPKGIREQECSGGKTFLPVKKERSLFPFPWEERKSRSLNLRLEAIGEAVSDFVFLTGNARIFFVSFL